MSKYYYVDSENVGDEWVKFLEQADEDSHFLIFYTAKSPYMSYPCVVKLLSLNKNLEFILCHEGNNALDFQLATCLGYQLCKEPGHEIYIISKDTGFDSIVHFWKERNISIQRIFSANYKAESSPVSTDTEAISVPVGSVGNDKICGESTEEIDDIIAACPSSNTSIV